jgi:hypothetical protein
MLPFRVLDTLSYDVIIGRTAIIQNRLWGQLTHPDLPSSQGQSCQCRAPNSCHGCASSYRVTIARRPLIGLRSRYTYHQGVPRPYSVNRVATMVSRPLRASVVSRNPSSPLTDASGRILRARQKFCDSYAFITPSPRTRKTRSTVHRLGLETVAQQNQC